MGKYTIRDNIRAVGKSLYRNICNLGYFSGLGILHMPVPSLEDLREEAREQRLSNPYSLGDKVKTNLEYVGTIYIAAPILRRVMPEIIGDLTREESKRLKREVKQKILDNVYEKRLEKQRRRAEMFAAIHRTLDILREDE